MGAAFAALVASGLVVTVATRGTDTPAPKATPAPAPAPTASIDAALTAFSTANAYFLKIPGIPGNSTEVNHANEIVVQTVSWGVTNATGAATGATIGNLSVTKQIDPASPLLMKATAAGTPLGTIVLSAEKNGSMPITYATLTLTGAKIRSFQQAANQANGFAESDQFSYTSAKLVYMKQNDTGTTTQIIGCWNFATHAAC